MNEVEQLDAKLKEIKFSNTHIGKIRTRAFDVYSIDSIVFDNCYIDTIEANAFTEKVSGNQMFLFIHFVFFVSPILFRKNLFVFK